jgi:hypothetical protein
VSYSPLETGRVEYVNLVREKISDRRGPVVFKRQKSGIAGHVPMLRYLCAV